MSSHSSNSLIKNDDLNKSQNGDDGTIKKLEEKVKKLEQELSYLRKENAE